MSTTFPRTATTSSPAPAGAGASPPAGTPRPPPAPAADPTGRATTMPATIALASLTATVAVGFGRLFDSASFVAPVLLTALVAHAVCWLCRRRDLGTGVTAVATLGSVLLVAVWVVLIETTLLGIPTGETLRVAAEELARAREAFASVVAPAPVLPGFVLATMVALGVTAFMAEWAAFRLHATFEACIPAFTLFLFTSALGTPRHRAPAVAAFVAATLAFLLTSRFSRPGRAAAWFGGHPGHGPRSLAAAGAILGVVALSAGVVLGPSLPGAGDPPLISYRNKGSGPSSRSTVSPLVDIRGRLVDHAGTEVFTVRSEVRAYWRLTALDRFDGVLWSSNDTYRRAKGSLGGKLVPPGVASTPVVQEVEIKSLGTLWLPAAYRAERVSGVEASYNPATGSLITRDDVADGLTYRVESAVPDISPAELSSASDAVVPEEIHDRYLDLPPVSRGVTRLARQITAGAQSPYDRAKALQDHFRSGEFVYDLGARPGHDQRALENFLLTQRRGYCEQFAGAYAVLARLVGLPSRVAVGFTPGTRGDDGLFHVRDEHAHAWPEVYLAGAGWVAFEPTPGRGAPGAEDYTGVPEAQEESGPATTATTLPATTVPELTDEGVAPSVPDDTDAGALPPDAEPSRPPSLARRVLLAVVAFAVALAGWAAALAVAGRAARARRRIGVTTAADRAVAAWRDAHGLLRLVGAGRRPAETLAEHAARAAAVVPLSEHAASELRALADAASAASYARSDLPAEVAARAESAAAVVTEEVHDRASRRQRVLRRLDPRPLVSADA